MKSVIEKNDSFFKQRNIKVIFSKARGCGYLLAEGARMVKLDASLTEKELLDRCEKFFFPTVFFKKFQQKRDGSINRPLIYSITEPIAVVG